MCWCLVVKY
jgi:hypothetical protein